MAAAASSLQMGRKPDRGNWPEKNELLFMRMLCERVRRDPDHNPTIKNLDWEEIDNELFAAVGVRYGIERLKGKHSRFRTKFRHFIQLLETNGVTWNTERNTVHASEKIWQTLTKQSKEFRTFRKKGCKHYKLFTQIFPDITGESSHHHLTMTPTTNSDEKPWIEAEIDASSDSSSSKSDKAAHPLGGGGDIGSEHRPKKKLRMDQLRFGRFDEALNVWVTELNGRATGDREKDENQSGKDVVVAGNVRLDLYSVEKVMDMLESMADVPTTAYMKAVEKFTNPDWRTIFVKMSPVRKREWLNTLV